MLSNKTASHPTYDFTNFQTPDWRKQQKMRKKRKVQNKKHNEKKMRRSLPNFHQKVKKGKRRKKDQKEWYLVGHKCSFLLLFIRTKSSRFFWFFAVSFQLKKHFSSIPGVKAQNWYLCICETSKNKILVSSNSRNDYLHHKTILTHAFIASKQYTAESGWFGFQLRYDLSRMFGWSYHDHST